MALQNLCSRGDSGSSGASWSRAPPPPSTTMCRRSQKALSDQTSPHLRTGT